MAESREARDSEKHLHLAEHEIRNLDKLLWTGDKLNLEEIEECVRMIKDQMDKILAAFKVEIA